MQKEVEIRVAPEELGDIGIARSKIAKQMGIDQARISAMVLQRRGIDARGRQVVFVLRYRVWLDQPVEAAEEFQPVLQDVTQAAEVIIVGAGPAGLFAALKCIELGLRPIVLERGKDVRSRRHDVAALSKRGEVNPNSNYCFGEGGAGTYSDGKLYTRANKRGNVTQVLDLLVYHGASSEILIEAHPHIGTNKLPAVVSAITETIRECGGLVLFEEQVTRFVRNGAVLTGVECCSGVRISGTAVILATGHSARDIFTLLDEEGLSLEAKPFALGIRVEHPQALIDTIQYKASPRHPNLPAASYSLRTQSAGRGVFSFCMCPGGIICPAATADGEVVVNGWSPSKRNSQYANSGIVVEVNGADLRSNVNDTPPWRAALALQQSIEQRCFALGGGRLRAPAQRLSDMVAGRVSQDLPASSYKPGLTAVSLEEAFPAAIFTRLQQAIQHFEQQRRGYLSNEAVAVATESRTSSPVRIPRDSKYFMHPQLAGLFPCGEGAGYAGGIMSAALDGQAVAIAVNEYMKRNTK